jgi:TetR/AcrR family transcriptional regulator
MITWAHLEGVDLDEPQADGQPIFANAVSAIEEAQANGHVDPTWEPADLLVLLFSIGLAWAHSPDPHFATDDPAINKRRRAAAVKAASRIIAGRT